MTQAELDAIRARCEAATPGPWTFEASEGDCGFSGTCPRSLIYCDDKCPACEHWEVYKGAWPNGPEMVECGDYTFFTDADAAFIAHARTDIPALLAEVERMTAERDAALRRAEAAEGKIAKIHTTLDYADRLHNMAKNAIELSVSNGLALGKIALTIGHEYGPSADAEGGKKHDDA